MNYSSDSDNEEQLHAVLELSKVTAADESDRRSTSACEISNKNWYVF